MPVDVALIAPFVIVNVSRRHFLQGATAPRRASCSRSVFRRRVRGAEAPKYGADGMPHGWVDNPLVFVVDRRRRHRHHRLPPFGDGPGRAHRHADDRGRRARSRLEARARRAGARRRRALRQPGHRRLPQHAALLHADAPLRRRRAHDARSRRGRTLERAGRAKWRRRTTRSSTGRRAGSSATARWQGRGRHARAGARHRPAQGSFAVPLHRQGQAEARRRPRHRHRQGAIRNGHAPSRHAVRRHRAAAGVRRQGGELRLRRGDEGARRGARSWQIEAQRGARRVQPAGRRRRHRHATPGRRCRAARR